jgi:DNA-binding GntR family transcriptional regulator
MTFQTLRQQAYLLLRNKLIVGELASGSPLIETELAKELGMSRTPVREAIRQMEVEGLTEYSPRCGCIVRQPDRDELAEMYTVREALESYAAADAARCVSDADLAELERLLEQMKEIEAEFISSGEPRLAGERLQRFLAADMKSHEIIVRASGNRHMAKILCDTHLLSRIFRSTLWVYDRPAIAQSNDFHTRLNEALSNHNSDEARQCMIEGMRLSRRNALEHWDESHRHDDGSLV